VCGATLVWWNMQAGLSGGGASGGGVAVGTAGDGWCVFLQRVALTASSLNCSRCVMLGGGCYLLPLPFDRPTYRL
jgi:hypothetical protein